MMLPRSRYALPILSALLAGFTFQPSGASAQLFERATVIRNARIITADGPVIQQGDILIKGGRIQQVGPSIELPFADRLTARSIDGTGKTITPGLIDAWSSLGRAGAAAQPDATASAWDAFDGYATDDFREALRGGVTATYIAPGGKPGIKGLGVVVRLLPGPSGSIGKLLASEAALCIDLGSEESPVARMKTFRDVRRKFRTAVEYRKSLDDYEEDLKEYLEKLEERRKAKEKEDESKDEKAAADKGPDKPKGEDKPKEDKPVEEPTPKPDGGKTHGLFAALSAAATAESGGLAKKDEPANRKKPEGEGDKKKEDDELKKPTKPKFDAPSEMLLKAIDHKLPVRIEAHRSADILNALALAEEYNLDVILEGATDGYLVAELIAEANVPVVTGRTVRTDLPETNEFRRHREANAAWMDHYGVRSIVASGGEPHATRFAALNAQLAFAHSIGLSGGADPTGWLDWVTAESAEVLGLEKRIGRLRKGMEADLVIWSDDPGHPASRVEQVFVGGELAYPAEPDRG